MSQSPEMLKSGDSKAVQFQIELQEMELMENSSVQSLPKLPPKQVLPSVKKLTPLNAVQKSKEPLDNYTPPRRQVRGMSEPHSNQQLLPSEPTMFKKSSQSSLNEKKELSSPARLAKKTPKGYQLASYPKTIEYLNSQTYSRKIINENGQEQYESLETCGNNQDMKQFGLGIYLYFEFLKRLIVALFIISVILIFPLLLQYNGDGLYQYTQKPSFTMTIAKFSLGNLNNADQQSYLIVTISDVLSFLVMVIFYLHWRAFHQSALEQMENDTKLVNPTSYVVSVDQICDKDTNIKSIERQLRNYIDRQYQGAYEVEIVYNYNGQFDLFVQYDEQIEKVEKYSQIFKQTGKQEDKLSQEQKKLHDMEENLSQVTQAFQPIYAIIHFSTLNAKLKFLNHTRRFKLVNSTSQAIQRVLCCIDSPPEDKLFLGKFPLMVRSTKLSRPQEVNWRNADLTPCSIFTRWLISIFLVFISIIITSAMIGFCTLYVASTSSCQNIVLPDITVYTTYDSQIASIQSGDSATKYCYCNANIDAMYTQTVVQTFCSQISTMVLVTNVLQVAASVVSSITNIILTILITVISGKLLRPHTIPKEYVFIFWGVLISNYINSTILPLLLNANVYGMTFISYLKFINFMDMSKISIFGDFSLDWYAMVSPYYVNMVIIAAFVSPVIGYFVTALKSCLLKWKIRRMCEAGDKQDPIIQKQANQKITGIKFDYPSETAQILLFLLITYMYSGLIPILIPIYTIGLIITFFCKKAMVVKYSVKIPADQTLSDSTISILPFILLIHGLFSLWSHTSPGIFDPNAPLIKFDMKIFDSDFNRIFNDIIILAEPALLILIFALDLTIFNLIGFLIDCKKDELQMPAQWAAIEKLEYSKRLSKANILGSYKLSNSNQYGHAIKAYHQLMNRQKQHREESKFDIKVEEHFE